MSRNGTVAASRIIYDTPGDVLNRPGFRVVMEDDCGNPVATSKPMTLGEAVKTAEDWKMMSGRIAILLPTGGVEAAA